ncbi:hypothetical protein G6F37_013037 [Rhizopus arrhizus]|nr:hypothetical protein G6F38_012989 [Rhizopus arrhizus]KAG1140113.1 hypothetical protein G6F37_013037 [Rhizopus arrhizus]
MSDSQAIVDAFNLIVSQNRYSSLSTVRIIYNYDPSTSIDLWLRLFEAKADRLGLTDVMKMEQLPSYLPVNMAQWLMSSPNLMEWESAKKALTETFGIPVLIARLNKKLNKKTIAAI